MYMSSDTATYTMVYMSHLPFLPLRGVNMYAMLVGKLPFRSPRQGTRKRQKLLEQIQSGLTEDREKDMSHVTSEGRDLLGRVV